MAKWLMSRCLDHEECVIRLTFVEPSDPTYDMGKDRISVPIRFMPDQAREFPGTVCVAEEHLPGNLEVHRRET